MIPKGKSTQPPASVGSHINGGSRDCTLMRWGGGRGFMTLDALLFPQASSGAEERWQDGWNREKKMA